MLLAIRSLFFIKDNLNKLVLSGLISIIGVNFLLDSHFYPTLLEYQAGSVAGKFVTEQKIEKDKLKFFGSIYHSFDFYSGTIVELVSLDEIKSMHDHYLFLRESDYNILKETEGIKYEEISSFKSYPVTQLTIHFLKPSTRANELSQTYLVHLK